MGQGRLKVQAGKPSDINDVDSITNDGGWAKQGGQKGVQLDAITSEGEGARKGINSNVSGGSKVEYAQTTKYPPRKIKGGGRGDPSSKLITVEHDEELE